MINKNIDTFLEKHEQDPTNIHIVYYLAQNYYFSQMFGKAIIYYKKFISLHPDSILDHSRSNIKIIDSYIKIGKCYMFENNLDEAFKHIWIACEYGNTIDPLITIADHYIQEKRHIDAYYILKLAYSSLKDPKDPKDPKLDSRKQEYLTCQYNVLMSRSSDELCKYEECYNSCQDALTFLYKNPLFNLRIYNIHNLHNNITNITNRTELIDELIYRYEKNREIMFREVYREYSSKPVVLFYCEPQNTRKKWNGFSIDDKTSRLEDDQISVILLAEELQRHQYKVIVCCDTEERMYCRDVEYIRISDYDCMLKTYILDHLVLSRYSNFLKRHPNVKNIYLWYHTLTPGNTYIDMDETKVKNIIVLSEYHKTQVCMDIPFNLHHLTKNINYSISPRDLKNNLSSKIKLRFIYLMYHNQYPDKLIELFIKIRNIYPEATLDIFLMFERSDLHSQIETDLFQCIFVHTEPTREEIQDKMMFSDYWIYSSVAKVERAYCLSALEAQASGCICIYPNIGSLPEIIGNRGVRIDSSDDEEIISSICFLEENTDMKEDLRQDSIRWALTQTYKDRVLDWINMFVVNDIGLNIYI